MILITGGLGHIGSATVQALLDLGEECVIIQRRSPEIPAGRFSRPVTVVQGDVKDLEALRAIGRDHAITGVVHMAGSMPWPPNADAAPVVAARDALGGLFNIIQVASEWGVKRVALALGNTPAVCRKSYIHPILCSAYLDGGLVFEAGAEGGTSGLRPDEIALLALLRVSRPAP